MTTEFKILSQVATAQDLEMEERIRWIANLSRRRDRILEAPRMDLEALAVLASDYEAAHMPNAAADLGRRLEWYCSNVANGEEEVKKMIKPLLGGLNNVELSKGYQLTQKFLKS
jgi:hypothetical protein